jgi:hypothetical protein
VPTKTICARHGRERFGDGVGRANDDERAVERYRVSGTRLRLRGRAVERKRRREGTFVSLAAAQETIATWRIGNNTTPTQK